MGDFDEERGFEYFMRMKDAIAETYVKKYNYSEDQAQEIATRIAAKLLIRNVGPDNAQKVFNLARKRGIMQ